MTSANAVCGDAADEVVSTEVSVVCCSPGVGSDAHECELAAFVVSTVSDNAASSLYSGIVIDDACIDTVSCVTVNATVSDEGCVS